MNSRLSSLLRVALAGASTVTTWSHIPSVAADNTASPGDTWEVTSQVAMEGMPMTLPPQKVKVCAPKTWKEPPGGADERRKCTNSDFKLEGTRASWKVRCAGPPAMSGEGEINREGSDKWSGAIKLASSEGAVTITLSGRKLGECENPQ